MKRLSAAEAKNGFGHLIDLARHEPVVIEKHNRAVVVVLSIEEYNRLSEESVPHRQSASTKPGNNNAV
ncbi:type II toxin-antitoxin system Phd/YefM family antitoxin [Sphingobium aromaticiconvertens]|uniref:type II toxin-antitoxin system Phd/YefM family antitoxin n=1 Tax=Sphingobium aromaticiconvertens TaxID=365341 RepID=UPI0030174587